MWNIFPMLSPQFGVYSKIGHIKKKYIQPYKMSTQHCYCIIMAGGSGTRFWPASRTKTPKQFMPASELGDKTLIKDTYERISEMLPRENIYVVTVNIYKNLVNEQLPELPQENLLIEPYGRDTAPCIAYASCKILKRDPLATTIIAPADHLIPDRKSFQEAIMKAADFAASNDVLVTLGLIPTHADTNFGYIQVKGGSIKEQTSVPIKVKTFTEKPDAQLAEVFVQSGEFLWNSGIFVWKASVILEEMRKYLPEMMSQFHDWENYIDTPEESTFINTVYGGCERISVAYAILEKTEIAWVYPSTFKWNDIGSWESLYTHRSDDKDKKGNVALGCKTILEDSNNNLIISLKKGKLIGMRGLDNYLIVDTDDALLICPRDDKRFKDLISQLALPEYEEFR